MGAIGRSNVGNPGAKAGRKQVISLMEGWTDQQVANRTQLMGQAALWAGYAYTYFAEGYCRGAFDLGPAKTPTEMWIYDVAQRKSRKIAERWSPVYGISDFAFSPTGKHVAFSYHRAGSLEPLSWDIDILSTGDGGVVKQVTWEGREALVGRRTARDSLLKETIAACLRYTNPQFPEQPFVRFQRTAITYLNSHSMRANRWPPASDRIQRHHRKWRS